MKIIIILSTLTLLIGFTSCKKDKEDPTITVSSPANHSDLKWGETVHIEATFEDDRALKNYTVMVGDEDGNHNEAINFMETGTTDESSFEFHEHFTVPEEAPMMAWIHFTVIDAEDKSATTKIMLHFEE